MRSSFFPFLLLNSNDHPQLTILLLLMMGNVRYERQKLIHIMSLTLHLFASLVGFLFNQTLDVALPLSLVPFSWLFALGIIRHFMR